MADVLMRTAFLLAYAAAWAFVVVSRFALVAACAVARRAWRAAALVGRRRREIPAVERRTVTLSIVR